jgi:hypothetical protein
LDAFAGRGLYNYLFGMLLWPLACGAACSRIFGNRERTRLAIALVALQLLTHIFLAVLLALAAAVAVFIDRTELKARARALLSIFVPAFLLVAFWFVPFVEAMNKVACLGEVTAKTVIRCTS